MYGRFDLAYDGTTPPKLLEYNADTPTSLLEAAVIQWRWQQDMRPERDQFNSIHERLLADCGDYTAHVVHSDGSPSAACQFAVCGLDLRLPPGSVRLNQDWKVDFSSDNIQPIAIYLWSDADSYGRHPLFISADERHQGSLTVPGNLLKKPGNLQVWVIGEHRLGRLKVRKDIAVVE